MAIFLNQSVFDGFEMNVDDNLEYENIELNTQYRKNMQKQVSYWCWSGLTKPNLAHPNPSFKFSDTKHIFRIEVKARLNYQADQANSYDEKGAYQGQK